MLDDIKQRASASQVHPVVLNAVVAIAMLPPLLILLGIGIAIFGLGVRMARSGELPALADASGIFASEVTWLVIGGALLGFYWLIIHALLGGKVVNEATENADDAASTLDKHFDD
jgi:hypothetical protein